MLFHFFIGDAVFLTWTITAIVCGIMGMKNYKRPQNANRSLRGGIITATITVTGMLLLLYIDLNLYILGVILLLIHILHIAGAYRQKKDMISSEIEKMQPDAVRKENG